jgi:hypothetical protein
MGFDARAASWRNSGDAIVRRSSKTKWDGFGPAVRDHLRRQRIALPPYLKRGRAQMSTFLKTNNVERAFLARATV